MKKTVLLIMLILIIVGLTGCSNTNKERNDNIKNNSINDNKGSDDSVTNDGKSLVLYFSATGTTKEVAKKLASTSSSDIIEIIPKERYSREDLSYNNDNCRANKEQNSASARPEIENNLNLEQYDTIYLGYPIWWGTIPKIILTLLDNYDLSGKTVIPFCTSGGSGIETSESDLKDYNANIHWLKGKKFSSIVTESELFTWINSLK